MAPFPSLFLPLAPVSVKEAHIVTLSQNVRLKSYAWGGPVSFFWRITCCGQEGDPQSLLVLTLSLAKDAHSDSLNPTLEPDVSGGPIARVLAGQLDRLL